MDMNSLAHTTWECKYHIVFAPKYRRKVIYKQIRADIGKILSDLCKRKGIEIIAAEACPDHVHMFVRIPPKYSVSEVMGYLKGKSSLMIFERHANLKYKYGNRHFWCRGYPYTVALDCSKVSSGASSSGTICIVAAFLISSICAFVGFCPERITVRTIFSLFMVCFPFWQYGE